MGGNVLCRGHFCPRALHCPHPPIACYLFPNPLGARFAFGRPARAAHSARSRVQGGDHLANICCIVNLLSFARVVLLRLNVGSSRAALSYKLVYLCTFMLRNNFGSSFLSGAFSRAVHIHSPLISPTCRVGVFMCVW